MSATPITKLQTFIFHRKLNKSVSFNTKIMDTVPILGFCVVGIPKTQ